MKSPLLWFLVLAVAYSVAPVRIQTDTIWVIPTALSLARDGDTDLSEYGRATDETPHGLSRVPNGTVHSTFPVGGSVLAVPAMWLTDLVSRALAHLPSPLNRPFERWLRSSTASPDIKFGFFDTTEVLIASAIVALGVIAFFFTCRRLADPIPSVVVTVALALGSPALSTWTRALWSHGPAFSALAVAAALIAWRPADRRASVALGIALAIAVISRPTAALPALTFFIVSAVRHVRNRRFASIALELAGALVVILPWAVWAHRTWGELVPPYYSPQRLDADSGEALSALAGQLFSPSRGLLVFVPIVLLSMGLPLVRPRALSVHFIALALGLAHLLTVSRFPHWWGGHCFGPRLSGDAVPFLLFAALPVVSWLFERRAGQVLVIALAGWGLFTNVPGATRWSTWDWSGSPADVDTNPARLWDWSDPQFRR